jgi:N-acetylmuramoyl-L-alanine amidase
LAARHVRKKSRLWATYAAALAVGALVLGAAAEAAPGSRTVSPTAAADTHPYTLQQDFAAAATEFRIPESVLLAVSYQETLWESHDGQPSSTGNFNVMGLTEVTAAEVVPATAAQKQAALSGWDDGRSHPAPTAKALALVDSVDTTSPAVHTLDAAAALLRQPAAQLRGDMRQSVRGGAALLASYERKLHGSLPADPGSWFAAVAEYDQAPDAGTAEQFADRVYATIAAGASRTTDDGQTVTLPASPSVVPQTAEIRSLPLPGTADASTTPDASSTPDASTAPDAASAPPTCSSDPSGKGCQCPTGLSCRYVPANPDAYDVANRPTDGDAIDYVVVHDTGGSYAGAIGTMRNGPYAAHYVVGASGAVTQTVPLQDTAVQTDNKTVDMHAVGIEDEGYPLSLPSGGSSWYDEQEYETTAALVSYLHQQYSIPLDRDHLIGQDDAPYALTSTVTPRQDDPGVYWDWSNLLGLVGAPLSGDGAAVVGGTVTVAPPFTSANEPLVTGCRTSALKPAVCPVQPANFVYLRTAPSATAPLIKDSLLARQKPNPEPTSESAQESAQELTQAPGSTGSTDGADVSDKAVYGQTFVVAQLSGDWTAVWYGGQKAWFYNPGGADAYANSSTALVVTPDSGRTSIPVYGRAYPELSAFPTALRADATSLRLAIEPLTGYTIPAGQAYTADAEVQGDYYSFEDVNPRDGSCATPSDCVEVIGDTQYYPIRYNHRLAFVLASDVQVITPTTPPVGTYQPVTPARILDTRYGTGAARGAVGAHRSVSLQVAGLQLPGQTGVPVGGVTAVVLNVTATDATAATSVSAYPDGQTGAPTESNLDVAKGGTTARLVVVPVGADGRIDLYNATGSVQLLADLSGYYTSGGSGSKLVAVGPSRILDTRYGTGAAKGAVGPGHSVRLRIAGLQLPGQPAIPSSGVTAVVLNVTATDATADTFVSAYPDGRTGVPTGAPTESNLDVAKGGTTPNLVITEVGADGWIDLYNATGSVQLLADLSGYYTSSGSGAAYHTVGPVRVLDTRTGTGAPKLPVGPGGTVVLELGTRDGVPLKATAAVLEVTAASPSANSLLTVYPDGQSLPGVSDLNFGRGETDPSLVLVPVVNGKVDFTNDLGSVQVVADLLGYYA